MKKKLTPRELWLLATPLLVVAGMVLMMAANNYVISREEQAMLRPTVLPDGNLIVQRRQADGSINSYLRVKNRSERLLLTKPADQVARPRGLFRVRNLVYLVALTVIVSLSGLAILATWTLLHRMLRRRS